VYGVALSDSGVLDTTETQRLRKSMRGNS